MTTVRISGGTTTVTIGSGATRRVTLDQRTVAQISANRPRTVVASGSPAVAVTSQPTNVTIGSAMGAQGPAGEQGPAGVSAAGAVAPITFAYGDATPATIFTAPAAGLLTRVRLLITEPFNGDMPQIRIGVNVNPDSVMPAAGNDPVNGGEFGRTPDLDLAEGDIVVLRISPGFGSSTGAGTILLQFVQY
jgi:hypothetical protein